MILRRFHSKGSTLVGLLGAGSGTKYTAHHDKHTHHTPAAATVMKCSMRFNSSFAGRVPNKGVREQPTVPDRLKDAMSYFGNQPSNAVAEDTPFVPQERRQNLVREVLGMHQNLKNATKLDRLKAAMDAAALSLPNSEKWREMYLFLRTTEQCSELDRNVHDMLPSGNSLWIDLTECEERRRPPLCRMPNGMLVVPVFSFEEYLNHYFQRQKIFDAVWFPVPRMGTKYEDYCKMEFPVLCTGTMAKMCSLATMAYPETQFGLLVNPCQASSKFITYPEMIRLADKNQTFAKETIEGFHPSLQRAFDTTKTEFTRVSASEVAAELAKRPSLPQIAQLEMQLLLFDFSEVSQVLVRTVPTPRWKRLLGKADVMTQLDIILTEKRQGLAQAVAERLSGWSFLKEFESDVHMEFAAVPPSKEAGAMLLYDNATDGAFLRSTARAQGATLKEQLGYDAPV